MFICILTSLLLPVASIAADVVASQTPSVAVPTWLHWLTGLVIIPLVWPFIKRFLVGQVVNEFVALIKEGIEAGDEDDDAFILAAVHWINKKCSGLGAAGPARFKVFAMNLSTRVKFLKGREDILAELAEATVAGVADASKKIETEQPAEKQGPTAPPAA